MYLVTQQGATCSAWVDIKRLFYIISMSQVSIMPHFTDQLCSLTTGLLYRGKSVCFRNQSTTFNFCILLLLILTLDFRNR